MMKLYLLPNGRMLLSADRAISEEDCVAMRHALDSWMETPGKIAVLSEPLEVIDLREPPERTPSATFSSGDFDAIYSASRASS